MINYDPNFVQHRLLGKGIEELSHSGQQEFHLVYTCRCYVCVYKYALYLINSVLCKYSLPSIFPINEYMPSNTQYNRLSTKLQNKTNKILCNEEILDDNRYLS